MVDIEKLIRPHLKELAPYSSARDDFSGEEGVFLDANENPYGNFNRYPDPFHRRLKNEIGSIRKIDTECIFTGNGSDEIIDLLFRIFCNPGRDKAIVFEPTFGMYAAQARLHNVALIRMELTEKFQINLNDVVLQTQLKPDSAAKLVFVCSPNNPTGNLINPEAIKHLLANFKGIVVIDEAYIDFSASDSWIQAVENHSNLVVLQTLSKAWGMAGLRVGFAFANPLIIQYLNKIKPPYNISSINQQIALEQMKKQELHQKNIALILGERERVARALASCEMVKKVYPSDANFILVEVNNADKVYAKLARRNIIVRNRSRQVENCLRITIGSPEENDLLITTFKNLTL